MLDPGDDVLPRLRDLVMRCPCAVLEGIRWSVVCKVYTDRYEGGPISASTLDAAKSSLADLVVFDDNAQGDTLLRLTDAAALSEAKANQLGCWPLLVQRLGEIVQVHGTRWESHSLEVRDSEDLDAEVPGILLGQLKPLLSRHWDSGFEERSIGFFNEVGQFVNLRKMKHFIAELLKWRAKRQELVRSQALVASAVDQALETRLILATSTRHNDMVLCCSNRGRVTMSDGCKLGTPSTPSPTKAVLTSSTASEVNPLSPSDASSPKTLQSGPKTLEKESQRLRIENAELKKRLQFGSEFLKQENRRLRVENAELKKRLYFAGPYAQGASATSVPIWVPVPVMASGCSGCGASPGRAVPQAGAPEQVSPHSATPGSVTPIPPRSFWVPLASNVMSPSGQPWPPGSQLVAVQISGPAHTPPSGSYSDTSHQENFLPRNVLSDPTTASQVSSNTSPDCHGSGFAVPFQSTDDRWVCIPSGIVERHKAQFETANAEFGTHEEPGGAAQASQGGSFLPRDDGEQRPG